MKLQIAIAVCLAALCAHPAAAQVAAEANVEPREERPADARALKMPVFAWATAVAMDQLTTYEFASRYRDVIREENPLTRGLDRHPALMVAAGAAIDATTGWLSYRLLRNHPRIAQIAFYSAAAYRTYLAAHNLRLMQNAGETRLRSAISVSMSIGSH